MSSCCRSGIARLSEAARTATTTTSSMWGSVCADEGTGTTGTTGTRRTITTSMMFRLKVAALAAGLAVLAGPAASTAPRETVFFDDFSGPTLDRTKWDVIVTGRTVNNEQQAYVDSPDTIGFVAGSAEGATNGALVIRPR